MLSAFGFDELGASLDQPRPLKSLTLGIPVSSAMNALLRNDKYSPIWIETIHFFIPSRIINLIVRSLRASRVDLFGGFHANKPASISLKDAVSNE